MSNLFLRAYSAVVQALAQKTGVTIKTGSGGYSTNGKVIYVPTVDEKSIGPLIHEVAHIRVSDFTLDFKSPLEKHISNILEDIRIEQWVSNIYPGAKMFLADMVVNLVATDFWSKPQEGEPNQLIQQYMLYRLRSDLLGQAALFDYSNLAEDLLREKVSLGMFVRLEALMYGVEKTTNTAEVQELAKSIIKMMEEEAKKEEEEREQSKQSDQNQPSDQPEGEGSGNDGNHDQSNSEEGEGDTEPASSNVDGEDATEEVKSFLRQALDAGEDEALADVSDALEKASEVAVKEGRVDKMGSAFTTQTIPNPVVKNSTMLDEVQSATNALRVQTQGLLQAETMATKRHVMQGTRIDPRKLHRAPTGGAIFQKVRPGKKTDTAIMVLVDRSGSMQGEGISLATKAALASSLAFDCQFVETAVMAFPYGHGQNALLKNFDERASAQVTKFETIGTDGYTPMAEAMMGAGIELANHRFQRKILLVATDGEPDNSATTKDVISLARRSGMEVLGLGIKLDVSKVFGKEFSTSVGNIDELPNAMISVLRSAVFN